jgi:steroid delta-isomerase-like uncharacterized protein
MANADTDTPQERNKKVVLASIDAINKHDVDAVLKDAAPDMVDMMDGSTGKVMKIDSVRVMIQNWFTAFPDYKQEHMDAVAEGNKVMVSSDCSGTWKGEFMGMKPSGKSFNVKDVDIFTFNDQGKITMHRSIQQMDGVLASVGMPMPPGHEEAKKQ